MQSNKEKLPIIYSNHYDIGLLGIEKLHPFDTKKYGKIYRYLVNKLNIDKNRFYYIENEVSQEDLLIVHTKRYLNSLKNSFNVAMIAEVPILSFIPNFLLQKYLLKPIRFATQGTIIGTKLALKHRWAINLSGGYHHVKPDSGGGFCYYADVAIAILKLLKDKKLKILIVDLDAHQGNGNEIIFKDNENVDIFDIYNFEIYPMDELAKRYIKYNFPVNSFTDDKEYLKILKTELPDAIQNSKPDLVIYIAGVDILDSDPLGWMSVSENGIVKRDEIVFKECLKENIPILMVLGGGYTKNSAYVISKSIENLLINILGLKEI